MVVAAAVLHMQDERDVQHLRLQIAVLAVGAQHAQDVFGHRKAAVGAVDVEAVVADVMVVGMVAVDGQHREHRDEC